MYQDFRARNILPLHALSLSCFVNTYYCSFMSIHIYSWSLRSRGNFQSLCATHIHMLQAMVQPSHTHDFDRGLESLYYTLRGSHPRTQEPFTETGNSLRKHSPGGLGSESSSTGPPADGQRTASGSTIQQYKGDQDRRSENHLVEDSSDPRPIVTQNKSSTHLAPLRIVGPTLRVDPEAEAVLLGPLATKRNDERRDRTGKHGTAETRQTCRRSERRGSVDYDDEQQGRRSQSETVRSIAEDASTISPQSRNNGEEEKLGIARMEQRMVLRSGIS